LLERVVKKLQQLGAGIIGVSRDQLSHGVPRHRHGRRTGKDRPHKGCAKEGKMPTLPRLPEELPARHVNNKGQQVKFCVGWASTVLLPVDRTMWCGPRSQLGSRAIEVGESSSGGGGGRRRRRAAGGVNKRRGRLSHALGIKIPKVEGGRGAISSLRWRRTRRAHSCRVPHQIEPTARQVRW
jgi:hypothetical protein